MRSKSKKIELFVIIIGIFLIVSSLSMFVKPSITGWALAAGGTAKESNVTVTTPTISCSFNDTSAVHNLSYGIYFGSVAPNTSYNNASGNVGSGTNYSIIVDSTCTTNLDFCIRADTNLTCHEGTGNCTGGTDTIAVDGNYSYDDSDTINGPDYDSNWLGDGAWEKADTTNVAPNSLVYWRFWLNVPFGQEDGQYNNTVRFKCLATGQSC